MSDTPKDPKDQPEATDDALSKAPDNTGAEDGVEPRQDVDDGKTTVDAMPEKDLDAALAAAPLISSGSDASSDTQSAEAAAAADQNEADQAEEHGGSFAGRLLTWLILLIAGGALALWGGPRLAPHLPAGLEPVAGWLTPGGDAAIAELEAFRAETEARFADLPEPPAPEEIGAAVMGDVETILAPVSERIDAVEGQLAGEVEAATTEIGARIGTLSDRIAALENAAFGQRMSQIETRLSGIETQIQSLTAFEPVEGLPEGTLEDLSQFQEVASALRADFQATLDGLRSEISTLAGADGALTERLEGVVATTERQITEAEARFAARLEEAEAEVEEAKAETAEAQDQAVEAERLATIRTSLTGIETAIETGMPFAEPLAAIEAVSPAEIPEILAGSAASGVATLEQLQARYDDAAFAAIRARIAEDAQGGVLNRLGAFVEAQVASRSLSPQEGDDADAVLSRAEPAVDAGDLAGALAELSALEGAAAAAMSDWISDAEARIGAADALATLRDAALATN